MSESLIGAVLFCGTALVIAVMFCRTWLRVTAMAEEDRPAPASEEEPQVLPEEEPVPESKSDFSGPLPVDPDNPPYVRVYQPRPGSAHNAPPCACHNRPVKAGQEVLFWPVENSGQIKIFCKSEGGV